MSPFTFVIGIINYKWFYISTFELIDAITILRRFEPQTLHFLYFLYLDCEILNYQII